jgi:hypothetical protein
LTGFVVFIEPRYRTIASCGNEENNLLYLFHEPKLQIS